jgi:hypothetical protein
LFLLLPRARTRSATKVNAFPRKFSRFEKGYDRFHSHPRRSAWSVIGR